jgi:hypothetical protein
MWSNIVTDLENLKGRDDLEDPCTDGMMILKWILKKWDGRLCTRFLVAQDRDQWRFFWTQ